MAKVLAVPPNQSFQSTPLRGVAKRQRLGGIYDRKWKRSARSHELRRKWRWAMRENLRPGETFPDIELASDDGKLTKLSSLMRGFPTVVVFSRGHY